MNESRKFLISLIFLITLITNARADSEKVKGHGCLMVFAWLFCMAASIFIARYMKYTNFQLCGCDVWFIVHVSLNLFVVGVLILAFLIILSEQNWQWVTSESGSVSYAHSIIGIITISFSIVQILIGALCRPPKDSSLRFFFNTGHATFGILIFTLAVINIFIGVSIDRVNLGSYGWGIVLGWILSVLIICIIMEIILFLFNRNGYDEKSRNSIYFIKLCIFFVYMIIIWAFMVSLVALIGTTDVTD